MAGLAIDLVQGEVLVKARHADKLLQRGFLHARRVGETHVVGDQRENLLAIVFRETQPAENFLPHLHSDIDVPIEADAVRGDAKSRRLANIVQQGSPGQCRGTRLRQVFEQ